MIFSRNNLTYIDGMMFVPATFPYNIPDALLIEDLHIQQLVEYCNKKQIQKVFIQGVQDFTISHFSKIVPAFGMLL